MIVKKQPRDNRALDRLPQKAAYIIVKFVQSQPVATGHAVGRLDEVRALIMAE